MFSDKEGNKKEQVKTIMGKGTKINGDLNTTGSIRVEGVITGKVKAEGDVFVGQSGTVKTEIEANKVVIAGKVEANIIAHEQLEILKEGVLKGDIKSNSLVIEKGAVFIGCSKQLGKDESNKGKSKNISESDKTETKNN